jgi:hypothetical protein
MKPITLSELIASRIAAKRIEDEAIQERRNIDAAIADLLRDPAKPEGSISQRTEGCKVTVTYKIDRKVDSDALTKAWGALPKDVQDAFKWKADVSVSALRKLDPASAGKAAEFVTAKPASPSITIEAV